MDKNVRKEEEKNPNISPDAWIDCNVSFELQKASYNASSHDYTWGRIANKFIMMEIQKKSPNFAKLNEELEQYKSSEQHAAWLEVAHAFKRQRPELSKRCFIEALYHYPYGNSTAW
jgi:hypothetical protein